MIKAFIFDFDGVIARTEDDGPRHAWDERLGLPVGSVERAVHHSDLWVQAQLGRITPRAFWTGVAELLYMRSDDEIKALRQDYFSGDRLNYRLLALIHDLRDQDHPVALLSNDSIELETRLRDLGIADHFDQLLISARIGVMKPDLTAYRIALRALGAAPHEVLLVDDSLVNVRGAQPLGIQTILFRPELDLRAEIEKRLKEAEG